MVHMQRVDQLMNEEIPHHLGPLKQQAAVQTDGPASRAAPPARALPADNYPLVGKPQLASALFECRTDHLVRTLDEPPSQQEPHRVLIADIATQRQQARAHDAHARAAVTSGRVDSPVLSTGGQLDARRRERCIRDCFLARFVALTLDPIAMALEKMLNGSWRGSRGHDDFYAPCVEHAYGQTTGASAFSDHPRLGGILVRPQRQLWRYHIRGVAHVNYDTNSRSPRSHQALPQRERGGWGFV